jgi:type VI secretion system protein ImpG
MGWEQDFNLLENSKTNLNGYRRVQEYFINKYKFLFVNLTGFDSSIPLPKAFKLRFKLNQNTESTNVNINSFKLFCAPAINLFDTTAEPIPLDHKQSDLPLKPIRNVNSQYTIYSILDVQGQNRRSSEKTKYLDFSLNAKQQSQQPVYELIQRSTDQKTSQSVLRVNFPEGKDLPMREVLTANIRCSNGPLTQHLRAGDINVNTPDVPDLVSFKNLSTVSEYIPPQTDGRILWNLLAHLTVNYLPITNLANLKVLLNLYNPTNQADAKEQAANSKRIESLKSLTVEKTERLLRGYLVRGQKINIDVDGSGFASNGDVYLFGELLFKVFSQFSDINSYVELVITNENTGEQLTWQPNLVNH